jgi:phospholipase/lecithinase/hemolysin
LQTDRFHPTTTGTYLAALVICARLTDDSLTALAQRTAPADLPLSDLAVLEAAADRAIREHGTP